MRALVVRAPTDSLVAAYDTTGTTDLSALAQQTATDSLVRVDTTMVTDDSPEVYRRVLSLTDRSITGPIQHDGSTLLLARDTLLPARTKTFEEALSSVIRDYQNHYEDQVLSRLRRRYEVETYPERLQQAFSTSDSSRMTSTN